MHKKTEVITEEMKELLWQKKVVGLPVTTCFNSHNGVFNRVLLCFKEW